MTNTEEDKKVFESIPRVKTEQEIYIDEKLRDSIVKSMSEQPSILDGLAKQLITLQLAIPGLYAVVFKVVHGTEQAKQAVQTNNHILIVITFLIFALALGITLLSLHPKKYNLDMNANFQSEVRNLPLSKYRINEFYYYSTEHKRCLITIATALTFLGICLAVITTLII